MFDETVPIRLPWGQAPELLVVIDTEEEFDWAAPPDRQATQVNAIRFIDRVQDLFDDYDIVPTYVIDYPIANRPEGQEALRRIVDSGRAELGAHLHPWVNPPHTETLSRSNMYPGNLPPELEAAKLEVLTAEIENNFGFRPTTYKAGRYGLGPNSPRILADQGYGIDLSFCPPIDYSSDGGPDYTRATCEPGWLNGEGGLLEIPTSGAFVGWAHRLAAPLYRLATCSAMARMRLAGILARLRAVDRLMLSPEGFNTGEHIKLTRSLLRRGVRTFTWSFHSPSVMPGCTPYVRNERDLEEFLGSFRRFFDFFFDTLGGVASTPTRLKRQLESAS